VSSDVVDAVINHTHPATLWRRHKKRPRTSAYISLEYLPGLAFHRRLGSNCDVCAGFTSCSDCSIFGASCIGLPNNNLTSESCDFAILWYEGSPAEMNENAELCAVKDGAVKLNLANGSDDDEVAAFAFAVKAGDWPNTTAVVVVTAEKGLDDNCVAARPENDGSVDVVHGTPNILSGCSITIQNHNCKIFFFF